MKKGFCTTAVALGLFLASPVVAAEDEAAISDRPRPMRSTGPVATEMMPGFSDSTRQARYDQPLVRSADFVGNTVRGADGEELGRVSQVLFDAESGQVRFLVVSTAGVEGMEGGEYLVPWQAVNTDPEGRRIALEISAVRFKNAPEGLTFGSQEQAEELHRFYGVAPYWEEPREREIEQEREHLREPLPE